MGNNKITPSKNEIYSKLLNVANKYTELDSDYLTSGLFGYITESIAMLMRDSSIHKNMLYNESFLNTAMMPKSVYNWAKMFSIEVSKATPAYADIEIRIPRTYVKSGTKLVLNYRDPIVAGDYYFSLERSIIVTDSYAKYVDDLDIEFDSYYNDQQYSTKYLKESLIYLPFSFDNENIVIQARAFQYQITKITKRIVSTSFLNKVHTFEFPDQFAGVTMEYRENGRSEKIDLRYSNLSSTTTQGKTAHYNLTDQNTLEIIFKNSDDGFLPSANSEIILNIFTTAGRGVPSKFTGDASIRVSSESLRSIPINVNFNPSDIVGGKDAPSLDKIKRTIINEISTRNTIVTESDLNQYFEILTSTISDINNGRIKFVKKRDDILRRIFTAYILLRKTNDDGASEGVSTAFKSYIPKVIKTNTINGLINSVEKSSKNVLLSFPGFTSVDSINSGEIVHSYSESPQNIAYICPFIMYITLEPIRKVKYLYTLVDNSSALITKSRSSSDSNNNRYFIPESVRVMHGVVDGMNTDDSYTITFTFKTNSTDSVKDSIDSIILGTSNSSAIDITDVDEKFEAISEGLYYLYLTVKTSVIMEEFDPLNKKMNIGGTDVIQSADVSLIMNGYEYVSENKLYFFLDLEDIMNSDLKFSKDSNGLIDNIEILSIPVIEKDDLRGLTLDDSVMNQLFTYIKILKENTDRLETSTFFDLKFYNTYGNSFLYNTYDTNIELMLDIELAAVYRNDETLKKQIRSYIRQLVDLSNDSESLAVSRIMSSTIQAFENYIINITFSGLNGTFTQKVTKNDVEERNYVPEWLNIDAYDLEKCITFS